MNGSNIAGGNPERGRVDNDYYATSPADTKAFLSAWAGNLNGKTVLEPAAGGGHMVDAISETFPDVNITGRDLIYRGRDEFETGIDFINDSREQHYDYMITNPPFNLAQEFVNKGLQVADTVLVFAKLQFLEGKKRKDWFGEGKLKKVYVYSFRAIPWRAGEPVDPETGKRWASTMAFAWYEFSNDYTDEPTIEWI